MPITDLIPWKKREPEAEQGGGALEVRGDPFVTFQQRMNRMFDDFFRGTGLERFGALGEGWDVFSPCVDIVETEKEIRISVELPGLDENDIDVTLSHEVLTISGEKRQEREEKGENYVRTERSYGSFRRSIPISSDADASKADAIFRNGVLTVTLPRTVMPESRKKIRIMASK